MSWIENAERMGELKRTQGSADSDRGVKQLEQKVAPEQVGQFLAPFSTAVEAVMADLQEAGYVVDETPYGFVFHSEAGVNQDPQFSNQFSLAQKQPLTLNENDRGPIQNYVYGKQWRILNAQHQFLGLVHLYAKADQNARLAGAEYKAYSSDFSMQWALEKTNPEDQSQVVLGLQQTISQWLERAESFR